MELKNIYHAVLGLGLAWLMGREGVAQGTKADYERAASLAQRTENRIYRSSVKPHWLPGKSIFWYEIATGADTREFVRVDAEAGERRPLFNGARLVAALSGALNRPIPASNPLLKQLDYDADANLLRFRYGDHGWTYQVDTDRLSEAAVPENQLAPLTANEHDLSSRSTGEATVLTFVNHRTNDATLYWLDSEGRRRSYGSVGAGSERPMSTFTGHVWVVVGPDGANWGIFEATETPGRAVLDEARIQAPPKASNAAGPVPGHPSPDGHWSLEIVSHNVQLTETGTSVQVALTHDGTSDDPYTDSIEWAPDSRHAALLRIRRAPEHPVHWIESSPSDRIQPKLHTQDYLKPGDPVAVARPYLVRVESHQISPISTNLCANPFDLGELHWFPDSRHFTFEYNQRGHQIYRVLAVDADSAAVSSIIEEVSPTFIDYSGKHFLHWSHRLGTALWMSERDGWNHLWRYDTTSGRVLNQVTSGRWVVREVLEVNDESQQIWFMAGGVRSGQDPYYPHLCRINFDGSGFIVLTEGDGAHQVEFSPDHKFFLDRWSRVDRPPVTELRRSEDGRLVLELEQADIRSLLETGWMMPERFVAKGRDGITDIHGILVRPSHFSADKKYPVVEEVYAGPQGAHAPKTFGRELRQHQVAELGFIVVQADGMGTSERSKAFHDVCWKNLADAGFPDRIAWIRAAAATRPWMDLNRVGIYGGSAGGQNALRALIDHSDFYRVAVADCGCHDNRMDKIWWNEQWMGWPVGPEYETSSNVAQAHRMQGKLLLIYGEMDTNVDPSSTLQVVNALERADRDFDLLVMTGTGHGAAETPYGSRRRSDFLVRHLWGHEPRWQ